MQVLFKPAEVEVEVSNQPLGGPTHTERERERGSTIAQDRENKVGEWQLLSLHVQALLPLTRYSLLTLSACESGANGHA